MIELVYVKNFSLTLNFIERQFMPFKSRNICQGKSRSTFRFANIYMQEKSNFIPPSCEIVLVAHVHTTIISPYILFVHDVISFSISVTISHVQNIVMYSQIVVWLVIVFRCTKSEHPNPNAESKWGNRFNHFRCYRKMVNAHEKFQRTRH